jgi:hypothetical protein
VLIVDGRRRARQIVNLVNLNIEWESHVMANKLESFVIEQVLDIKSTPGEKIIDANNLRALAQKGLTQVGA